MPVVRPIGATAEVKKNGLSSLYSDVSTIILRSAICLKPICDMTEDVYKRQIPNYAGKQWNFPKKKGLPVIVS